MWRGEVYALLPPLPDRSAPLAPLRQGLPRRVAPEAVMGARLFEFEAYHSTTLAVILH